MNVEENNSRRTLFRRYADGLYTTGDVRRLSEELHASDVGDAFRKVSDEVWCESDGMHPAPTDTEREQLKAEARRLLRRIRHRRPVPALLRRAMWFSCKVAVLFVLLWGGYRCWDYLTEKPVVWYEVTTAPGQRRQLTLPDGTELMLNSCSRLRYPSRFPAGRRRVELEGEAYFSVHPDEDAPFTVTTLRFDVRVLGTCFNVKSYASDELVTVQVESGKVQVDFPEAMMRLRAMEQLQFNTHSGEYSKSVEAGAVAVWRRGVLRFRNTPIRDVVKELERMYGCTLRFEPHTEFNNLISGEHDNQNLESVLQSIEYTTGIRHRREGGQIWLYK